MEYMRWYLQRCIDAFWGLWYAFRYDFGFRVQAIGFLLLVFIVSYIFYPLREIEILFLGLAYTLIVITELQNTALEEALDKLHPEDDVKIRSSKDMAAGSVLAAGLFLAFVLLIIISYRFV